MGIVTILNDNIQHLKQLVAEGWNANVTMRAKDLEQGTDHSYVKIIQPWVLDRVCECSNLETSIIDVGCGCGYLTNQIYKKGFHNILGIDLSPQSVSFAGTHYPEVSFLCQDICCFEAEKKFSLCLAVMVLNNMPDFQEFFSAMQELLDDSGRIILVLPHPCFWPQRHLGGNEFPYHKEQAYKFHFSTKGCCNYIADSIYFHRTLSTYFKYISDFGYRIVRFEEFNEGTNQGQPDIIGIELKKTSK